MATIADARRVIAYAIQNGLVSTSYPEGLRVDEYVRDNFSPPCALVACLSTLSADCAKVLIDIDVETEIRAIARQSIIRIDRRIG